MPTSQYQTMTAIALLSLATGCQTTGEIPDPVMQELVVIQPITFPLGGGNARFQYGSHTTTLNPDDPYCIVRRGAGRGVEPDTFIVTGVEYGYTSAKEDGLPQHSGFYSETRLWLHSPAQPSIRQLVCRGASASGGDLNVIDIQAILGDGFILR